MLQGFVCISFFNVFNIFKCFCLTGEKKRKMFFLLVPSPYVRNHGENNFSVPVLFPKPFVTLPKMTLLIFCLINMKAFPIQKSSYCKLECV